MMAGLSLEHPPTGRRLESLQEKEGLLVALLLTLLALVVHFVFYRRFRHLPPGPWPWPVVGNLFLLGSSPHQTFARLAQKYGPLMYIRLGSCHTIIVSSPAVAKEFLLTHDHVFQYRRPSTINKILTNGSTIGHSSGPLWRQLRKICMTGLFSTKCIHSFQAVRMKEIRSTMKDIKIKAQEGKVVDLDFQLSLLATNIMTEMAFGKRYFGEDEKGEKEARHLKQIVDDIFGAFGTVIIGDYVPSLWWVSKLQGVEAPLHELRKRMKQFAQEILDEHRRDNATTDHQDSTYNDKPKDFIDVLLSERLDDGSGKLSDDTIEAVLYVWETISAFHPPKVNHEQ
jgi:cytochrome P450